MWLIQKRPLSDTWLMQSSLVMYVPSMNPRGRTHSVDSSREHLERPQTNICCISSDLIDRPPNYEDALINSKPINSPCLNSSNMEALDSTCQHASDYSRTDGKIDSQTGKNSSICSKCRINWTNYNNQQISGSNDELNHRSISKSSTGVTNMAMKFVEGFKSCDIPMGLNHIHHQFYQQHQRNEPSDQPLPETRKVSFCQLDVSQLDNLTCPPPQYSDLTFGAELEAASEQAKINRQTDSIN